MEAMSLSESEECFEQLADSIQHVVNTLEQLQDCVHRATHNLRLRASISLRKQTLGTNLLVFFRGMNRITYAVLEAVSRAGPKGLLQIDLANACLLSSKDASHHVSVLATAKLVYVRHTFMLLEFVCLIALIVCLLPGHVLVSAVSPLM